LRKQSILRQGRSKRSAAAGRGERRLHAQNRKLLDWLDSWMTTPDDRGERWWRDFEADLENHRLNFGAGQPE